MAERNIGHFSIIDKLGEGGMGEVYRARDTKLNREVALKILPEAFAADSQRMSRFEREAQVLASLNHPNIGQIYGLEDSDGKKTLVLELIEGQTLAERIEKGALSPQDAAGIALQIAEALEVAHDKGIVHRDLKPANIKLTPDGKVKVLDFGLAKALQTEAAPQQDLTQSPTLTMAATQAGLILGTAGYMSPEQAAGLEVDRRADIWAFGVILYEMLCGRQLFRGETVSHTLAAVLREDVDWNELPAGLPPAIQKLLGRCLHREVRRRLQAIGEARVILEDLKNGRLQEATEVVPAIPQEQARPILTYALAGLSVVLAAVAVYAFVAWPAEPKIPLRKFEVSSEDLSVSLTRTPVISPAGNRLAFPSSEGITLREMDRIDTTLLAGTEGASHIFWSPDSTQLGFVKDSKLWRMSLNGERTSLITSFQDEIGSGGGFLWMEDGTIYYTTGSSGMLKVSSMGGDPEIHSTIDTEKGEEDFHGPTALPDGKGFLAVLHHKEGYDTIEAHTPSGRHKVLQLPGDQLSDPLYSQSGHLIYHRRGQNTGLWAVPFSLADLQTTGEPFLINSDARLPSLSRDDTLVYFTGRTGDEGEVYLFDRSGKRAEPMDRPQTNPLQPKFSPDETQFAVSLGTFQTYGVDIWIHDTQRGTSTRLVFEEKNEIFPLWFPNGEEILFTAFVQQQSDGVFRRRTDGTGEPEAITEPGVFAVDLSEDGRYVILVRREDESKADILYLDLLEGGEPVPLFNQVSGWGSFEISPDNRYISFSSSESGTSQVYIRRFPSGQGRWQVSVDGGRGGIWSKDGREIFFSNNAGDLFAVPFEEGPRLGTPELLFQGRTVDAEFNRGLDVTRDGQRFLAVKSGGQRRRALTVTQNWFAEFQGENN